MKSKNAYLTFDDGPSGTTDKLVSFLKEHTLPAIFFCRGDHLTHNNTSIIKAIQTGVLIGNHSFAHRPTGDITFDEWREDFEKTEQLINECYKQAGQERPGYYYRFPYIDKGNGDRLERHFSDITPGTPFKITDKMRDIQSYLRENGFSQPFKDIDHPLYKNKHIGGESDCLFTYSSCDWMLLERHEGKWPFKTLEDLKNKMKNETYQENSTTTEILLFHDDPQIYDVTTQLILFAIEEGINFLSYEI